MISVVREELRVTRVHSNKCVHVEWLMVRYKAMLIPIYNAFAQKTLETDIYLNCPLTYT